MATSKIGNKTINFSVYVSKRKIGDTTEVELPSIEQLTDTIKGAGILGEVDLPSPASPGSMELTISTRVSGSAEDVSALIDARDIEIRWATDILDTSTGATTAIGNKAFIKCMPKTFEEGKLEPGAAQEGSCVYEVFAYKRIVDGKNVLEIDKFNGVYKVNGKDLVQNINSLL